jgi:hypothetical protein
MWTNQPATGYLSQYSCGVTFAALLVFGGHFHCPFLVGVMLVMLLHPPSSPTSVSAVAVAALLLMMVGWEREGTYPGASSQLKDDYRFVLVPSDRDGEVVLAQVGSGEHGGQSRGF